MEEPVLPKFQTDLIWGAVITVVLSCNGCGVNSRLFIKVLLTTPQRPEWMGTNAGKNMQLYRETEKETENSLVGYIKM